MFELEELRLEEIDTRTIVLPQESYQFVPSRKINYIVPENWTMIYVAGRSLTPRDNSEAEFYRGVVFNLNLPEGEADVYDFAGFLESLACIRGIIALGAEPKASDLDGFARFLLQIDDNSDIPLRTLPISNVKFTVVSILPKFPLNLRLRSFPINQKVSF